MSSYEDFLASKQRVAVDHGRHVEPDELHPSLFEFQRDVTAWAIRKGRAAIFADTGLGKTRMQVCWARALGEPTLILAPLAVTQQTVAEAARLGIEVTYARDQSEAGPITITNYERLDRFVPSTFGAVVLDESSILKSFSGSTKKALVAAFKETPYRLCCTATPAPNDIEELCNHADFLGVMKPSEMRSTFFIADSRGAFMKYRLKGHAEGPFFRWLSSWAMALKRPSDLGYRDSGFKLPGLDVLSHFIEVDYQPDDRLFVTELRGITEASAVRRATTVERAARAVELVKAEPEEPWLVWCGTNEESALVTRAIPGAVEVKGSDSAEDKAERLLGFAEGAMRCLVSKPSIAGYGMNFQRCARMAFVGLGYSFEQYYQAIRRCYRFGQTRPVKVHVVLSSIERPIFETVLAKEREATNLSAGLIAGAKDYERYELFAGTSKGDDYEPHRTLTLPHFLRSAT